MCGNCGCDNENNACCSSKDESCGKGCGCGGESCGTGKCGVDERACSCDSDNMDRNDPRAIFMWSVSEADNAWNEMFREKLMDAYEKKIGKEMEKTADFFVEQSMEKWMDEKKWHENKGKAMEEFQKMMEAKAKKKK